MPESAQPQDFASLYDRYFSRVYGFVRGQVGDPSAADDVTSRVFERVLDRLDSFDPARGGLEPWLFAVARNAVCDHFRSRRWRALLFWQDGPDVPEPAAHEPPAEQRLLDEEESSLLLRGLQGLAARDREVLGLKFQAGLTNRQIAETLGLGESHVGVLAYRAIKKLQAALGEDS